MKNNIDESNIAGSRPRPRGTDRMQPGEGSINPGRRILKPQPQSNDPTNRKLAKWGGTQGSKESRTGPSREWNAVVRPTQPTQSSGGGITYISRQKTETKQAPTPPTPRFTEKQLTIIRSLSAKRRKKLGIPDIHIGGPIDLTHKGKNLKPGKTRDARIGAARSAGSQTRIARRQREIIKEFIDNYRKSIL